MNYSTLIIEDEQPARIHLRRVLRNVAPQVHVIGEATNGEEGLVMIQKLQPELIFLDIQMPVMDGFNMLSKLIDPPAIIFTTAYDQYALKAFEENSIDYLLKPIRSERLIQALHKLQNLSNTTVQALVQQMLAPRKETSPLSSLSVKTGDRIVLIPLAEVAYFQANDKYVTVHTLSGHSYLYDKSLSNLEQLLPPAFMRIHRSLILNLDQVQDIRKGFKSKLIFNMKDRVSTQLSSGRSYGPQIRQRLDI